MGLSPTTHKRQVQGVGMGDIAYILSLSISYMDLPVIFQNSFVPQQSIASSFPGPQALLDPLESGCPV